MRVARLDDVCEINPRQPQSLINEDIASFLPMAAVSEGGYIAFEEERPVAEVKKGYTYFERGDVLVAKITPCFENGKAARTSTLSKPFGFGSTEFHVLRSGREIDEAYLFHLIWNSKFRTVGAKSMTGSAGQKRVPADFLRRTEIPLPPLPEQRRIAAILDKADALRRQRQRAVDLLDSLTQSIFLEMFGDPKRNPLGFPMAELGTVADFYSGNSLPEGTDFEEQTDGYLLLKVSDLNLQGNERRLERSVAWSKAPGSKAGTCYRHAVVFPKRGGAIGTNKKRKLQRPAILDPNLMAVAPHPDSIHLEYLFSWFQSFRLEDISSGSSVPQLNKQDLAPLAIAAPPMEDQQRFANRCLMVEALEAPARTALSVASTLFASLQSRAFAGEL